MEVADMKQRLLTMVGKSEKDDTVIDRLKDERREREEARERDELRWQQKEQSWQHTSRQLEAQAADWQLKWQHGQQWEAAIDSLTKTETGWTSARVECRTRRHYNRWWHNYRQRCDELTADKLTAHRTTEAEARRIAKQRLSQPKLKAPSGAVGGGSTDEERGSGWRIWLENES